MPTTEPDADDPYSLNLVRFALKTRSGSRFLIDGSTQKHIHRLGDRVSVAILKIVPEEELRTPQMITKLLLIIGDAFAYPYSISAEADKKPEVTLLLLRHLYDCISDGPTREKIAEMINSLTENLSHKNS